jgi:hypothetical protein
MAYLIEKDQIENLQIKNEDIAEGAAIATDKLANGAFFELNTNKNISGGYAGLTLFKLNLKNALGTITSWFTTSATVARTWTLPDKDGTVAMLSDIPAVDNSIEIDINFQDLTTFTYVCPVAMKFTSQTSQGTAATLSVALNTNMTQFQQLTVTPTVTGLVILKGVAL